MLVFFMVSATTKWNSEDNAHYISKEYNCKPRKSCRDHNIVGDNTMKTFIFEMPLLEKKGSTVAIVWVASTLTNVRKRPWRSKVDRTSIVKEEAIRDGVDWVERKMLWEWIS